MFTFSQLRINNMQILNISGDVNAVFLLLNWGASPDSTNKDGDTPLLWLLKSKTIKAGNPTQELIKLLLRFGAGTLTQNAVDGNSPLHVLVTAPAANIDLRTAFLLYVAAGKAGKELTNNDGLTPYSVSM